MEEERKEAPAWEPMEVDDVGHVGEVLQGPAAKISPVENDIRGIPETF